MVGMRRASIVLPEPGAPTIITLWPPAAAISNARLTAACPLGEAAGCGRGIRPHGRAPFGRHDLTAAVEHRRHLAQRPRPDNLYALDHSALLDIGTGQEHAAKPPLARHSHKRQHAPYPAQRAVERELADEHRSVGHTSIDLPGRGENGYGYRQIVERPLLAQIGRGKVHDDLLGRHAQLRIFECRAYALLALLDRAVGQADEIEPYAAGSDIGFDGNVESFDAREGTRMNLGEHRYIILYCIVV